MAIEAADLMRWKAAWLFEQGEPCGAEANMAKFLASEASWPAANAALDTHGGFGFAEEYDIERKFRETRLYQVAPITNNLVPGVRRAARAGHAQVSTRSDLGRWYARVIVDPLSQVPVRRVRKAYEQVADQLRELIVTGEIRPAQKLPNEATLARDFGVSRATIREALRVLATQHLIRTSKGTAGGSFVTLPTVDHISDFLSANISLLGQTENVSLDEFLELRELLEVPAARLAARRRGSVISTSSWPPSRTSRCSWAPRSSSSTTATSTRPSSSRRATRCCRSRRSRSSPCCRRTSSARRSARRSTPASTRTTARSRPPSRPATRPPRAS